MVAERKVCSLTELDQEHPIAFLLVGRKYNDTSEVVVIIGHLFLSQVEVGYELALICSTNYLRKETQDMISLGVGVGEDVEKDCPDACASAAVLDRDEEGTHSYQCQKRAS